MIMCVCVCMYSSSRRCSTPSCCCLALPTPSTYIYIYEYVCYTDTTYTDSTYTPNAKYIHIRVCLLYIYTHIQYISTLNIHCQRQAYEYESMCATYATYTTYKHTCQRNHSPHARLKSALSKETYFPSKKDLSSVKRDLSSQFNGVPHLPAQSQRPCAPEKCIQARRAPSHRELQCPK